MTFAEYIIQSSRSREVMGKARPGLFCILETGRNAAVMALVLTVMDVTPLSLHTDEPWWRLWFIGIWSVVMALLFLWRLRARPAKPDESSHPVI